MNCYDFDETVFTGDSEDRFFKFMFKKPGFRHWKLNFDFWELLCKLHIVNKTVRREHQYEFLRNIDDVDKTVEEYWNEVQKYMKPWYFKVKKADDIIASGTPRFLLIPIMKRLGLKNLVATEMDPHTGKIDGHFAVGEYKPVNFKKDFPGVKIEKFYSDAYSDHFLAEMAEEAYVIHDDDKITPWDEFFAAHPEKMK